MLLLTALACHSVRLSFSPSASQSNTLGLWWSLRSTHWSLYSSTKCKEKSKNCYANIMSVAIFTLFMLLRVFHTFAFDLRVFWHFFLLLARSFFALSCPKIIYVNILHLDVILREIFSKWFVCLCIYIYLCGIFCCASQFLANQRVWWRRKNRSWSTQCNCICFCCFLRVLHRHRHTESKSQYK